MSDDMLMGGQYEILRGARALPIWKRAMMVPLMALAPARARVRAARGLLVTLDQPAQLRGAFVSTPGGEKRCWLVDETRARVKRFTLPKTMNGGDGYIVAAQGVRFDQPQVPFTP